MERRSVFAILAFVIASCSLSAADVDVKQTTYADLEKAIQAHKGKVILVDVWSLA